MKIGVCTVAGVVDDPVSVIAKVSRAGPIVTKTVVAAVENIMCIIITTAPIVVVEMSMIAAIRVDTDCLQEHPIRTLAVRTVTQTTTSMLFWMPAILAAY